MFGYFSSGSDLKLNSDSHLTCQFLFYIYVSGVMCCLLVSVFIELSSVIKLLLVFLISLSFSLTTVFAHPAFLSNHDYEEQ